MVVTTQGYSRCAIRRIPRSAAQARISSLQLDARFFSRTTKNGDLSLLFSRVRAFDSASAAELCVRVCEFHNSSRAAEDDVLAVGLLILSFHYFALARPPSLAARLIPESRVEGQSPASLGGFTVSAIVRTVGRWA